MYSKTQRVVQNREDKIDLFYIGSGEIGDFRVLRL